MRLPRLRLRTLMLMVAVAGGDRPARAKMNSFPRVGSFIDEVL
jgi:hypothetical protein